MVQRKNVMSGSGLPVEIRVLWKDASKCEIYLVEGDSAGGTKAKVVIVKFQTIMPLRGRFLNVEKAMHHKIFENEELKTYILH